MFTSDLSMEYSTLYIARGTHEAEEAKRVHVDTLMISIIYTDIHCQIITAAKVLRTEPAPHLRRCLVIYNIAHVPIPCT